MDVHDENLLLFWNGLNQNNVRYIMVGGFATRFHGFNRHTQDLDLWIDDTVANRQNLRATFNSIGYGDVPELETMRFIPGWTSFLLGTLELDILTSMKGMGDLTFDDCLQEAQVATIEGVKVPFLHINHLIQNKKIVNRPKDQVDVIELERIKYLKDNNK